MCGQRHTLHVASLLGLHTNCKGHCSTAALCLGPALTGVCVTLLLYFTVLYCQARSTPSRQPATRAVCMWVACPPLPTRHL
jgi:hypothetical protein